MASLSGSNSLGERLREARSSKGMTIDDVAQSLRLSPRIISALEEDAYDRLPSPTYVRGYLRSYGMLLGIPPQQLIDAFNTTPQAAQRVDMTVPAPARQITSSDVTIKFGTTLVVALVIGLAVLWWSGHDGSGARRRAAPVTPTATVEQPPAPTAEVAPSAPAPSTETVAKAEPAPAPAPTAPVVADKPAAASTPTAATAPPATTTADPNAPRARVIIRITEDSWVDVRDAEQRRLVYETIAAGRVVNVEGVAPLSVFLGNVEGVTVEFNGKPYDALRHKRGQVARFTLGSTGAN